MHGPPLKKTLSYLDLVCFSLVDAATSALAIRTLAAPPAPRACARRSATFATFRGVRELPMTIRAEVREFATANPHPLVLSVSKGALLPLRPAIGADGRRRARS